MLLQRDEITLTIATEEVVPGGEPMPTFKDTYVQEVAWREEAWNDDTTDLEAMEWLGRQAHEVIFELLALPKGLVEPLQCAPQRNFPYYF